MAFKALHQLILKTFDFQKKESPKFLQVFQDKNRKLNLILLSLFLLTFPNQNYYQSLQPYSNQPLVRPFNYNIPWPSFYAVNKTGKPPPSLTAEAALVVDLSTKAVLFAKNPDLKLFPASTTKIMTALVAVDYYKLDEVLTVNTEWQIGQIVGLKKGEKLTFESLLYALLVGSGNDVAYTLAENYPGGVVAFVKRMNEKGEALHLKDTNFTNVAGIDALNHKTTAHDLAILTTEALRNQLLSRMVATRKVEIFDTEGKHSYSLESTNKLLGQVFGVKGVKTGWTENAGECLVAYTQREKGEIVTVVLASEDRFGETARLIEWVYDNFTWETTPANYQQLPEHNQ